MGTFEYQIRSNVSRTYFLIFLFILVIAGVAYSASFFLAPEESITVLIIALVVAIFMSWASYYHSDKLILGISGARRATKEEFPYLVNTVEGLCLAAGLPTVPRLYIINDTAPNAFATGRDPEHSVVCVTSGLLQKLDRAQLEGVLAHELSHVYNRDILVMSIAVVLVGLVALTSDLLLRFLWYGGGSRRSSRSSGGGGSAGAILALIGLVFLILSPIIAQLIQLAVSRKREFLADATAAQLTRYPEGLAQALEVLQADTEPLEAANKATAHLYIVNPLLEYKTKLNSLFDTHPPTIERIRRLRAM